MSKEFDRYIHESTNLFTRIAMPNVGKARQKELDFEARLAALAPR